LQELDKAIAIKPTGVALLTKAKWLSDSSPDQALDAAKKAAAAGNAEAYYYLGAILQSQGKTAEAIAAYEAYLAKAPTGGHAAEVESILKSLKGG
jgi:tetratricopeptide (TPR) repeat protein